MSIENNISSIAIGSFDGIHLAHQQLIAKAEAIVVIERGIGSITAGYKRALYTTKPIFFYHFNNIKELSPKEFIEMINYDFPNLKKIVVGYDFVFGKNKQGDTKTLKKLFSNSVDVVDEIKYNNISIHTRVIKDYIKQGDISTSNRLLGRRYTIDGDIVKGQGLGAKELVATLNLTIQEYQLPKDGVYATYTMIDKKRYRSVSFIGHRVTTDGSFAVETHLLDTTLSNTPKSATIEFVEFIRDNMKFDKLEELKAQIELDIDKCFRILV